MSNDVRDLNEWIYAIEDDGLRNEVFSAAQQLTGDDPDGVRFGRGLMEALGLSHGLPWLGVFARHWELQHRINDEGEGATAVPDAVRAFELSLRPENRDCPQSICATQDLAMAYSATDGPGYSDEVIAACNDTLERIDPTWPCYDCVSAELRTGLMNQKRYDETIALNHEVEVEIRKMGASPSSDYPHATIAALIDSGRLDEAGELARTIDLSQYEFHGDFSAEEIGMRIAEARLLTGDPEPTQRLLEGRMDPLDRPATADEWLRLIEAALTSGVAPNDNQTSTTMVVLAQRQFYQGAYRRAFDTAITAGIWAARRGALTTARRALDLATAVASDLTKPVDATDKLAAVAAEIEAAPDRIPENAPLDQAAEALEAKLAAGTLEADEYTQLSRMRQSQGWADAAQELGWDQVEAYPNHEETASTLLSQLIGAGDSDGLERLAAIIAEAQPVLSIWCRAQAAVTNEDWPTVAGRCSEIIDADPTAANTLRLWSFAEQKLGNFPASSAQARAALDLSAADLKSSSDEAVAEQLAGQHSADAWQTVVAASLAEDWPLVRRCATIIGMELTPGDGPVEEAWEWISLTFRNDDFSEYTLAAQRTGPSTARVLTVVLGDRPQQARDLVVFTPTLLDPIPESEEERSRFVQRFGAIHTLETGGYDSVLLKGWCADADAHNGLREALDAADIPVWSYSEGPIKLETGETVFDVYSALGYRDAADAKRVTAVVEEATADWAVNLIWEDPTGA